MAHIVGIAGPSCTGKSTLAKLLDSHYSNNSGVVVIEDLKDTVWKELVRTSSFSQFEEVYSDRDYLMMYCCKWIIAYRKVLDSYATAPDDILVIIDCSHLDLLIYMNLQFWYHYPSHELLTSMVQDALDCSGLLDVIYMTNEDDVKYDPVKSKSLRQRMVDFKRSREIEIAYYNMFRDLKSVVSVGSDVSTAEYKITTDLEERGYIPKE